MICNATSVDGELRHAIELLRARGDINLTALFGPEHGVRGDAQDMIGVDGATDALTGLPVHSLYGHTEAADFDSLAVEAIREEMIVGGLCRNRINKDVARVRRMFRWGEAKKLVPVGVFDQLKTVEGLRAGRSSAPETEPVRPVAWSTVERALKLSHTARQTSTLHKTPSARACGNCRLTLAVAMVSALFPTAPAPKVCCPLTKTSVAVPRAPMKLPT